ncbi:protocadherin beta-1 isoform X28 [Chelonia mydas]|uniref:protocadherin beta-1 isoform X28 n=1 Tax=Chelonia mydas TaxID=8469 RepID=UPI001CA92F14|nr:protocadherin beta-1 isoform X28 [Chelonia mydas]
MADKQRRTTIIRQVVFLILFLCVWALGPGTLRYSVPEEMESGSFVANVAKDLGLDEKRLSARKARVVSEGSRQHFQLNSNTGDLFIKEKMDREELCGQTDPCILHFEIILENPLQSYRAEVRVYDVNDHSPEFSENELLLKMPETTPPGSRFPLANAQDLDVGNNSLQSYAISSTDHFRVYTRHRSDGRKYAELVLKTPLDREEQAEISFMLTAIDGGSPARSGAAQHGIAGTDSGKEQDLLTNLQLNTDVESANQQAQPNPDWRFSQAQRPGTSGSQNGEEGGAWPNNQFDTEMLQAMILASANEAADGNSTLGGGAGTMGLSTRYGPQFTLQHVPDYRQNVYIPGSTATLSNSSGKRDGKSSGSSGGNKKKSGKKEKK